MLPKSAALKMLHYLASLRLIKHALHVMRSPNVTVGWFSRAGRGLSMPQGQAALGKTHVVKSKHVAYKYARVTACAFEFVAKDTCIWLS